MCDTESRQRLVKTSLSKKSVHWTHSTHETKEQNGGIGVSKEQRVIRMSKKASKFHKDPRKQEAAAIRWLVPDGKLECRTVTTVSTDEGNCLPIDAC